MPHPEAIYHWRRLDDQITTSGQPTELQLKDLHALGMRQAPSTYSAAVSWIHLTGPDALRLYGNGNAADFRPDAECLRPGGSVLGGSDVITAEMKQAVDLIVG
jgi:hypothetical protein